MSLLRHDNVLFYHPLDSDTEYIKSFDWSRFTGGIFDTGIVTSGFTQSGATYVYIEANKATGGYDDLENSEHFAIAFWSSGLYCNNFRDDIVEIGFGHQGLGKVGAGVRCFTSDIAQVPYVRLMKDGTGPAKEIPIFPSTAEWHLTIVDFSKQGSVWQYLVSINGSGWQNIGSGSNADPILAYPYCTTILRLETTSKNIILDEVAVWADQDLFTDQELSNLYELVSTYDQPMNQYYNIFGTPVNSGVNLFTKGSISTSGNISLYIPSQKETKLIDLFTKGSLQTSGNIDLFITGTPTISSSSIDLFLKVAAPINNDTNLYTVGPLSTSDNIDNFIWGYQISSGNINQHIHGDLTTSGNIDLYISGVPTASSSMNLYVAGPLPASGDASHFIWGHESTSGNTDFYIKGLFPTFDAFVSVVDQDSSNSLDLFVHGVLPGESGVFYTNDTIALFINDSGEDTTVDSDWSAFVRVADAAIVPYSGIWQSFVKGSNAINNNIDLYINAHISGENPHGQLITHSLMAFVEGQATQDDEEGLLSDGYFTANRETAGFAKVHLGLGDTLNLYVSGEISVVTTSTAFDLFILGISGIVNDSHTLYIPSKEIIDSNYNLFIFGIQDTKSGNSPLYIEVTDIGLFNQESSFYTHGF